MGPTWSQGFDRTTIVVPMPDIVLLYDPSCPNIDEARATLLRAFSVAELPPSWREVDLGAHETPLEWRAFGSPTILVDGVDVDGGARAGGASCRLYAGGGHIAHAPSADRIAVLLQAVPSVAQQILVDELLDEPLHTNVCGIK